MAKVNFTFNKWLQADIDALKHRLLNDPLGVLDQDGVHHEFVTGVHGQKLDFDKIKTHSDFYIQWVCVYARAVRAIYADAELPDAIVGIANGANRLAHSISAFLGDRVISLETEKIDDKSVRLTFDSIEKIENNKIDSILIIEDVGTSGSTVATAVDDLLKHGISNIAAINFWQCTKTLQKLDKMGIGYYAAIDDVLPTFEPDKCKTDPNGFCKREFVFIPHGK